MRMIKRKALLLNLKKSHCLKKLCRSYAKEKQYWLDKLKAWDFQALLGKPRDIRDAFVKMLRGFQARKSSIHQINDSGEGKTYCHSLNGNNQN